MRARLLVRLCVVTAASVHAFRSPAFRAPVVSRPLHHASLGPLALQASAISTFSNARSVACPRSVTCPRMSSVAITQDARRQEPTAVYALLVANIALFVADKVLRLGAVRKLYLYHTGWAWWQPLSATFCHASRAHLSGNAFLLLLFGRSVEDELGWVGLLLSYAFCGVAANLASLVLLPAATVSLGASGAVFGLFAVSVLARLSWRDLDWRKVVEVAVLGQFAFGQVIKEAQVAAGGGVAGTNHVAHLSGAAAGVLLVTAVRGLMSRMEANEKATGSQY